jgi:hypothetical protein
VQWRKTPHAGQSGPPQSTSDSMPFSTESVQLAARHAPWLQTALAQSASTTQCASSPHGEHDPPQSVSVSLPFLRRSLHRAAPPSSVITEPPLPTAPPVVVVAPPLSIAPPAPARPESPLAPPEPASIDGVPASRR